MRTASGDNQLYEMAVTGRLAKNTSQTGEVLLNGRRKTTLSYGTAVCVLNSYFVLLQCMLIIYWSECQ